MKKALIASSIIILLIGCSNDRKGSTASSNTHGIQQLQKDFQEEEKSVAYDEVKKIMVHAIEFRETDINKASEIMLDAIKKMERSRLKSYELRADVHNAMGTILQRKHNYTKALAEYDRALHLYDSATLIPSGLEKRKSLAAKLASTQVNNGIAEMYTHDYYHAKIGFDQVIRNKEIHKEQRAYALQMKASVIRKEISHRKPHAHDVEQIWKLYEAALKISDNKHSVSKNIADFLSEQGAYIQADKMYLEVVKLADHDHPREQKNEEGDLHFRQCKNIITNFDMHGDKKQVSQIIEQLKKDAHKKYYDTHYLQADIEYLMALGYFHLGDMKALKQHLEQSSSHNAKHVNAIARNSLLKSYVSDQKLAIAELYKYASLSGEHWKFQIEKRLVELLKENKKKDEAKTIEDNLLDKYQIVLSDIGSKHPKQIIEAWKKVKSDNSYMELVNQ